MSKAFASIKRGLEQAIRHRKGKRVKKITITADRAWRAEKAFDLKGPWKPYPPREKLYQRPVLRRR